MAKINEKAEKPKRTAKAEKPRRVRKKMNWILYIAVVQGLEQFEQACALPHPRIEDFFQHQSDAHERKD